MRYSLQQRQWWFSSSSLIYGSAGDSGHNSDSVSSMSYCRHVMYT